MGQVFGGVDGNDTAFVDDDNLFTRLGHLRENVGAQNDGVVSGEVLDQLTCLDDLLRVEAGSGLVKDQHIGIVEDRRERDCARDCESVAVGHDFHVYGQDLAALQWEGEGLPILALHGFGSKGLLPDCTFLLDVPAETGVGRAAARDGADADRFAARDSDFHRAVAAIFDSIADQEPERVRRVDASGDMESVTARLIAALDDLLP